LVKISPDEVRIKKERSIFSEYDYRNYLHHTLMNQLLGKINPLFLPVALMACLLGCSRAETGQQGAEAATVSQAKKLEIAVIPKGTTHVYWNSVHAGAAKAARELDVTIYWQGPLKEDDRQVQIQTVQNFISRGVDAIALAPLDARSLVPSVKAANGRNIPVVIFDSDLDSDEHKSFVATDNIEGGKLSAKRMAEVLGGKGNVILLRYAEGSASTTKREEGFLQGMKEYGPDIQLVSTNQYAGVTIEKAFQVAQNLLNRFPDVNGVFCTTEPSTQAMLRALQTAKKAGKVKLIGFDANEMLIQALRQGELHGLAIQDPFQMGYLAVKTARQVILGEPVEKRIDTGVMMVTPENLEDQAVKDLLYPKMEDPL
jgi:ribose transport system substrate-binding protein